MAVTAIIGICIYTFFAFTYIGQGNAMIRRMRTTFRPTEDASFNVRLDNQKKLAEYLRERPFGEGLGLGGVEAKRFAERTTTLIPHDSTYVKIWMGNRYNRPDSIFRFTYNSLTLGLFYYHVQSKT